MSAYTPAPLFGRDWELAELHAALRSAESGRGALVLLVGEPGIGKTRLANDFASEAGTRGARVTWGRAWEAGGAPAYWPWIEAMRPFAALTAQASDAERTRIAPLAHLIPTLEGCEAPKPAADPAQDRFRLFEAVASFLALAARDRPLVVLLDDLHVADLSSLGLLYFVARHVQVSRVVVVATYRDVEARLSAETGDALAKVAREGRYLALRRLERDEVASWAAAERVCEADALFTATEGNPLFIVEMLRLARDRGGAPGVPLHLSAGVRDVIRMRLASLSPAARALLDVASVSGRTLDLDIAATQLALPITSARDLATEAVRHGVLVDSGDRTSFSHILIRDVLYQDLSAARRSELHERVARVLLDRLAGVSDASLAEAVHHLFAAVPLVPADEAIAWARRGAERAVLRLLFEEAAALLARATELLPPGRDGEKCDLLLELAGARIGAGQATLGRETALAAASIARRLSDAERLARAALRYGSVFVIAQVDRALLGLLEEALAALPADDSALRSRLLARLAAALQPADDPEHPITLARQAIAMARRVADEPTRLEVLVAGTSALLGFADPRERLPLDTELVTIATRAGDRLAALRGLMRLVFDHLEQGDGASADSTIEEYDTLSRAVDLPAYRWRAPVMRAMRVMMDGKFAAAEALCADAATIASRVDDANAVATLSMHALARAFFRSQWAEVGARLPAILDTLAHAVDPFYRRAFRASMLAHLGRAEEAREDLEFLALHDPPLRGRIAHVWLADACLALGDARAAAKLVTALEPLAHRRFGWSPFAMVMDGRPIGSWVERLKTLAGTTPVSSALRAVEQFELLRDGELWTIRADTTFHLRDSRGLSMLAMLVQHPKREFHATDLVAPAGAQLGTTALAQRLEDLRDAEAEATKHNDTHRAQQAREELEALTDELAQSAGLQGHGDKTSAAAQRARVSARKRILDAISRIREHSPALAKHLERSIRTGLFCSYDP
ncbi:MAG TPA: AAA family ATPase [Polyangiales bacterium]|nr:AAA family ATPase [Polyangiales bacterium]